MYIGLGALKYYILKVDQQKRILLIQKNLLILGIQGRLFNIPMLEFNQLFVKQILIFLGIRNDNPSFKRERIIETIRIVSEVIQNAAQNHSPALLANFVYDLVREYNSFIRRYLF
jgi:arginyl-tRNA synthetase